MSDQPIEALVIGYDTAVGQQHFEGALQREFALCAADSGAGPVWAEHRGPTTVSRVFALTPALAAILGSGSVELAIGVTARIEPRHPSAVTYEGAGAAFHAIMRSNPAMRQSQQPLPDLPPRWASAISRAARGERLLGPSPEVAAAAVEVARASRSAAAAVEVARASRAVASAPKPVAPATAQPGTTVRTIKTKGGTMTMVPGRGWLLVKS